MKAVRLYGMRDLRAEIVADPGPPAAGCVTVKVRAVGICGSDLHNYKTGMWISHLPVTPGHELAGEIVAVGDGVSRLREGDKIVADSRVPCGACATCLKGRPNVCLRMGYLGEVRDGGFAEYVTLPADRVMVYPDDVSPEIAALSEPLGVALHVIQRADLPDKNGRVIVAGAGAVGGLVCIALSHLGHDDICLIERNERRADLIAEISGARRATVDDLDEIAGPEPCHAIDATGSGAVVARLLDHMCPASRIVMVGIFAGRVDLDLNRVVEGEVDLIGSSVFVNEQRDAISLLRPLEPSLQRILSKPLSLDDIPQAFEGLATGATPDIKVIATP